MATVTKTVTLIPSGNTGLTGMTINSSYPIDRGYTDANSTTYCRFDVNTSTTGSVYFTFDTSEIPAGAIITSVTARGKARVSNTTRVTNTVMQLYANTTAKGSNRTFAVTTASTQSITAGTWTRTELNNLRLKIGGTASSSTSSRRIDFYGADVTVTYTVTAYDITASGDGTIDPTSETVEAGGSCEIRISGVTNPTVTDNGVDVTGQLDTTTEVTETGIPNGNTVSGFTASNISNAYADADSSTYADLTLAGRTTGTLYLPIGGLSIPSGATIKSVTAKATLQFVPGSSTSGFTASCQMYAGNTAKGSSTSVASSSTAVPKTTFTLNVGTWTASEIANARFYLTATNNASSTQRHMYVFGVSFSVTYESDGVIYVYTLTNIQSNHTIVVTNGGGGTWTTIFDDDVQINPDSPYNYIYYTGFTGAFEANTTYRVTWDGVTYTCQSQPNANTYDGYSVGNMALGAGGTDTGEPFLLYRAFWDSTVLTADTTSDAGDYGRWIHCKIEKLTGGSVPPVITVGTPSRTRISAISNYDQCVCTFTSDLALSQWEARATKAGVTPARGVGLLVESGGSLAANTPATIYVENEELTQGDGEYTITVYGQSTDGVWSA